MELKIKSLKWSAGMPVAMLNDEVAKKLGVHAQDRILIKTISRRPREISTIVDVVGSLVQKGEIGISEEIKKRLDLRTGQKVDVAITLKSKSVKYILDKLNGKKLSQTQIFEIINDIVGNSLSEAEIALFVSAMYDKGMSMKETIFLIKAILQSGNQFRLKQKFVVDKHSIGGIPGNRTTPIVVAICASAGLTMPKSSSRAITSAAGTADVIETVAKIEFSIPELKKIVNKTGGCMVWGGALGLVPADAKIIQIEKSLGIDPQAQLLASIMSKKLAVGSKYILIDIPYGKNAKVSKEEALQLKKKFEYLGKYFKKKLKVVLTYGNEPIGKGIGPALELIDVIEVLDPKKQGPEDLEKKSCFLAGQIFEMTGKSKKGKGQEFAKQILDSGKAFKKFKEIIKAQRGHLNHLVPGKFVKHIIAKRGGVIDDISNKKITLLARTAGCPADKYAGLYIHVSEGQQVDKGNKLLSIYAESSSRLKTAVKMHQKLKPITFK